MSSLSTFLKTKLSDHVLRDTAYTKPGVPWLALHVASPTIANTGAEVSWTAYEAANSNAGGRVQCAFNNISTATSANTSTVTFVAVDGISQVTVTHWGLYDAQGKANSGNLLLFGALTAPKTLDPTDVPSFPANALQITWN